MRSRRAQACASRARGSPSCCGKRGLSLAATPPHTERSARPQRGGPGGPAPKAAQSPGRGGRHRAPVRRRVRSAHPSVPGACLGQKRDRSAHSGAGPKRQSGDARGLDWAGRELIVRTSRTKRSADFIALLEEVDRRYGPKLGVATQPLVLVLDNGPIHTSKATRAALAQRAHWLTVEWLPKYAPELNDIEALWRDLKRHHLAHQTFNGPDDLDRAIQDAVAKLNAERHGHPWDNHRIAA